MSKDVEIDNQLSPAAAPVFMSGLSKSVGLIPDGDEKIDSGRKIKPDLAPGIQHRLEIPYAELEFHAKKGQGSYGEVFKGEYRRNAVAIKLYDFRGMLADKQRQTLLHEADLMEGLRSDYLVGLRGICFDPRYCLVMEYCEGGTLRARLDDAQREIDPKQSLLWAQQISYGIYNLHSIRITHSDLKGENVLLDAKGHAKVADFGLSVLKSASASQSKRVSGHVAGTLPWMAPELFNGEVNSAMTDVYSLGIILWEIASRRWPFAEKMPAVITGMVLAGKREAIDPTWIPVFSTMIQACWQADPKKRPTAEQVGDEFKVALASIEVIPPALSPAILTKSAHSSRNNASPNSSNQSSIELSDLSQPSIESKTSKPSLPPRPASPRSLATLSDSKVELVVFQPKPAAFGREQDEQERRWTAEIDQEQKQIAELQQQSTNSKYQSASLSLKDRQAREQLFQDLEAAKERLPSLIKQLESYSKKLDKECVERYQDPLISACETGDLAAVKAALRSGADPTQPSMQGKMALPAAIYGMNQEVIDFLKSRLGDQVPTLEQCVAHNKKYYGRTFYFPEDEKECQAWLERRISKSAPEDKQLVRRGVTLEDIVESKSEYKTETRTVGTCYSICGEKVHLHSSDEGRANIVYHGGEDEDRADIANHDGDEVTCAAQTICCPLYWTFELFCLILCCCCQDSSHNEQALEHIFCWALPCTTISYEAKQVEIGKVDTVMGQRVKNSSVVAHTLWGEMEAIRKKHSAAPVSPTPAPARMQMS